MSLKTTQEFYKNPYSLPINPHFEKFFIAWTKHNYDTYFFNSLFIVGVSILLVVIIGSMGGYFFANFRFKFSEAIFYLIFLSIMLPPQVRLIPLYQLLVKYRLINTYIGLILVYSATQLPFTIYILRTFFETIPSELLEAARIDGCSEFKAFIKVMLPTATPGITAVTILNLVQLWNEFLYAVTLISSDNKRTLPLGLVQFLGEHYEDVGMVATGVIIGILPILIFYIFFSEKFIEGMIAGSLKG